jgi:hypothetical protein
MGLLGVPKETLPSPLDRIEREAEKEEKLKEKKISALIERYHTANNCLGYYIPELVEISENLGNSESVLEGMLCVLKHKNYPNITESLDKGYMAGAYWLATYNTGERRTEEKVAKAFKTNTAELRKGIREITKQNKL